jgi:preprotein translocase subunit SecB
MTPGAGSSSQPEPFDATPERIYLTEAHFSEPKLPDEAPGVWSDTTEFEMWIGVYRHSLRKLSVAVNLDSSANAPADFSVAYAGDFVLDERYPEEQIDSAWQSLAFDIAPRLVYPYIREEVARLTAHSRVGMLVLPVLPLPVTRPPDFKVPPAPEPEHTVR